MHGGDDPFPTRDLLGHFVKGARRGSGSFPYSSSVYGSQHIRRVLSSLVLVSGERPRT